MGHNASTGPFSRVAFTASSLARCPCPSTCSAPGLSRKGLERGALLTTESARAGAPPMEPASPVGSRGSERQGWPGHGLMAAPGPCVPSLQRPPCAGHCPRLGAWRPTQPFFAPEAAQQWIGKKGSSDFSPRMPAAAAPCCRCRNRGWVRRGSDLLRGRHLGYRARAQHLQQRASISSQTPRPRMAGHPA